MHADGPRAVGHHGKPVEASASTTASDVGDIWKSDSKYLVKQLILIFVGFSDHHTLLIS